MNISIMPVDDFKALTKSGKAVALKEIRERYSDKDIRDAWNMKYDAYNYYLMQLGLKAPYGKAKDKEPNVAETQKAKTRGKGKFIDVEHRVINEIFAAPPEEKQLALATEPNTGFAPISITTMLNFPAVVGNAAQLRKRLESYLAILECEGEEALFQMKFVIDRK